MNRNGLKREKLIDIRKCASSYIKRKEFNVLVPKSNTSTVHEFAIEWVS